MSDDGDCCLNSPCCEKCANCCCCDDSNKKKTPEEERREQERLQIYMRSAVYIGYLFATIGFFTLDHFAWHYNIFMIVFWILFMTSFTSYEMLRTSNPGYLKHLPAPASKSQAVKKDTLVPENTAVKRRNTNTAEGIIMMNDEFEPTQRTEADCGEDPSEDGVVVQRHKFCKKCGYYVAKYDHHCFWLGTCIGEQNHVLFMSFLLLESVFLLFCWGLSIHAMWLSHFDIVQHFAWSKIFSTILVAWISFFVSIGVFFFPFCLCLHHAYLIATNQTSYEVYRPYKLEYLKNVAETAQKFDEGICQNCLAFWMQCFKKRDLSKLARHKLKTKRSTSFLVNFDDYFEKCATCCC